MRVLCFVYCFRKCYASVILNILFDRDDDDDDELHRMTINLTQSHLNAHK